MSGTHGGGRIIKIGDAWVPVSKIIAVDLDPDDGRITAWVSAGLGFAVPWGLDLEETVRRIFEGPEDA